MSRTGLSALLVLLFCAGFAQVDHSLPDPKVTPGAIDPISGNDLKHLCDPLAFLPRPEFGYTRQAELVQLNSAGYVDKEPSHYEENHLIPIILGGAVDDQRNLWPEPYTGTWNARLKDRIDLELHRRVCLPRGNPEWLPLDQAQREIATNWINAYKAYLPAGAQP